VRRPPDAGHGPSPVEEAGGVAVEGERRCRGARRDERPRCRSAGCRPQAGAVRPQPRQARRDAGRRRAAGRAGLMARADRRSGGPSTPIPATPHGATLEQLLSAKEVVVTCGAGGVGKTTTAAALATMAAIHLGGRVLVLTVDPARRLADALGLK